MSKKNRQRKEKVKLRDKRDLKSRHHEKEEEMTAQIAAQLGPLMADLMNECADHGVHDVSIEIIESFVGRAYGLGKTNPENLNGLLVQYYAEAAQDGMHKQIIDLGEKYMRKAFDIGAQEAAAS